MIEDSLPPGETVRLPYCPWYVVPRKQWDGTYILWNGTHSVRVTKRDIRAGILRLERSRNLPEGEVPLD